MKGKLKSFGIIAAVAIIGLAMSGCATSSRVIPDWDQQLMLPCGKYTRDYIILGVVQVEESRTAIIGVYSIPIAGTNIPISLLRFSRGEATYAALLARARARFPTANAVIGVQIDRVDNSFLIFFSRRRYILTGLAVEFAREPNDQTANLD